MRRRWIGALAAAFVAVSGLTLIVRGERWAASHLAGTTGGAQWIWIEHDRRQAQPLAFYAVRDFALAAPPPRARLLALGDPEYVLSLNGKRVGAGSWRPGAHLDEYEVGPLLRIGGNRLLAELRSAAGGGGFLASLIDKASGRPLLGTDGGWRTFRRHRLGLLRGWLPIEPPAVATVVSAAGPGEAPVTWGRPPVGRWGRVVPPWPRPLFAELTGGRQPLPATSTAPYVPPPATGVRGDSTMVLFDWGRQVTGYLALETGFEPGMDEDLEQPPPDRQRTALLWTGDTPPQPAGSALRPSGTVVMMPSADQWLDARLRRFRYALVIGLERPLSARVYAVEPWEAARSGLEIAPETPSQASLAGRGVFGLAPPRLRTPVEDEVRRKLERLQGVAGRKDL
ncbi:MAG TPA: hypothetical protein VOA80_11175 [Thermoanaerobaculia bacterium]|nr:hypothetical protein [Thermoanaerobaculia bacterium]